MFMKYFAALFILFLLAAAPALFYFFNRRMRRLFWRKTVRRKIAAFCFAKDSPPFFSAYVLQRCADLAFAAPAAVRQVLWQELCGAGYVKTLDYLESRSPDDALGLLMHFEPQEGLKRAEARVKTGPQRPLPLLLLALAYVRGHDFIKLRRTLEHLEKFKLKAAEKDYFYFLAARIDLYDGDMYSASQKASAAAAGFRKRRMPCEEAAAYLLMGEIYRACAVYDVAGTMFDSARKIYELLELPGGAAAALAAKGMLMSGEERFAEAAEYFKQSRRLFAKLGMEKAEAEVINQQALLNLLQKRLKRTESYARRALEMHKRAKNPRGCAFSRELLSIAAWRRRDFAAAAGLSGQVQKLYLKQKNYSAYLDAAFIEAQALFELDSLPAAETVCRRILNTASRRATCFHVAGAYSLLGLIYVRLNDFDRARALFKQSLGREQCNSRYAGAAADYANLAMIERKSGNTESPAPPRCLLLYFVIFWRLVRKRSGRNDRSLRPYNTFSR